MMKKIIGMLPLSLMIFLTCSAQEVFNSLEDLWKYADDHNINIRVAQYSTKSAMFAKQQSYSTLLPLISASGSFTDNTSLQTTLIPAIIFGGSAGVYQPVQFGQKFIYAGGIAAQMDIVNLQSWYNVQIAKVQEQLSKDSLANIYKTVYQQIAAEYYSYLLMEEAAKLASESETISDSIFQAVNNKYNDGIANAANVDLAKINLERAQQANINARYQMLVANNNLKGLLNLSIKDSLVLPSTLQKSIEFNIDKSFLEDPAIRLSYNQRRLGISQYKSVNSGFWPSLSLFYSNTLQQNDNKFEPFKNGPLWYPARYWSIRASWIVFNGGTRYFQSKRSKILLEEKKLNYENTVKQSGINDANICLAYNKSVAYLAKSQEIMQLSFDNYSHISDRYLSGIEPIENRLNAFTDYLTYQNQYLNSLSDMMVQLYQIKIRQHTFR